MPAGAAFLPESGDTAAARQGRGARAGGGAGAVEQPCAVHRGGQGRATVDRHVPRTEPLRRA